MSVTKILDENSSSFYFYILGQSVRQMTPEYVLLAIGKVCSMALVPFVVILYSPYIDDNVSHGQSATYISVVRSASEIGPVFGMGLGAYLSQVIKDWMTFGQRPRRKPGGDEE